MAKSIYVCQECGHNSYQWLGRCPSCSNWNTFVEEIEPGAESSGPRGAIAEDRVKKIAASRGSKGKERESEVSLSTLEKLEAKKESRWNTGISELDRVLGGGMVEDSYLLLGGEPGIGKSTLLLQTLEKISQNRKVLYVSGEESAEQIKLRAQRLGVHGKNIFLASETSWEKILKMVEELQPDLVAVDSIQTVYTNEIQSAPGSVSQVREVGARLMHLAKKAGMVVILVGHVTKDGTIAGPRVLEHMVDTVLYFEPVGAGSFRILRAVKNRFGSTNEIGVFDMKEEGLVELTNPSELFLAERPEATAGSVVVSSMEGTRPLLVEVQALVTKSGLANPRRTVFGLDGGRASILFAVLEKKIGLELYDKDVFLNVVGGLEIKEQSSDLGIMVAIASSYHNQPVPAGAIFLGEIGLTGEVRSISRAEARLKEAESLGFRTCFLPERNWKSIKTQFKKLELVPVRQAKDVFQEIFGRSRS